MTWRPYAPCASVDPELWFDKNTRPARRICASCPFKDRQCLTEALQVNPSHGVWAGRSSRQIRELRARLGLTEHRQGDEHACPDGHERAVHGFRGADGKLRCRACNRSWLRESRAKKRAGRTNLASAPTMRRALESAFGDEAGAA